MKRREFLTYIPIVGVSSYFLIKNLYSIDRDASLKIIQRVQEHILPLTHPYLSAQKIKSFEFFMATTQHTSFDSNTKTLLLEGAKKIHYQSGGHFLHYNAQQQEKFLHNFTKVRYGYEWMRATIDITLEASLCDKVYSNNAKVFDLLALKRGKPLPKTTYIY